VIAPGMLDVVISRLVEKNCAFGGVAAPECRLLTSRDAGLALEVSA
jgi:hypothetical protein